MDEHLKSVNMLMVQKTISALEKNRMGAHYLEKASMVNEKIDELLAGCSTVSSGGSQTLDQCGTIEHLKAHYNYLDRYVKGLSPDELNKLFREVFFADGYLLSANAITQNGELYNVDGTGNRVAPLIFGPKRVIVVAGINKIVPDIAAADERVRRIAAPANTTRLHRQTPCVATGVCSNCCSPERICCSKVITTFQREASRIQVILVGQTLGY